MTTMPDEAFEWRDLVLVDPPPEEPEPPVEVPDTTIMVPEPTEPFAHALAGHWTRRNIVSGDESWSTVHGSASRAETVATITGDATITAAAGTFEEWDPGAPITGVGIPAGTTILSVASDTEAEMSAAATGTNAALAAVIGLHGVYSQLQAGEGYLTPCPAGDFEVIALVSRTIPISDRMIGPWIVDSATGHGVLSSWYSAPNSWLTLRSTGWAYTGGFTQGSALNMPQATTALKLRKAGTDYYTSYSLDYGATWSAETPAQAWTGTPTHMGFGCILGAAQATKLHEFYPGPEEPEEEEPEEPVDPPPYLEWQTHAGRTAGLETFTVDYGAPDAVTKPRPLEANVTLARQLAGACPPAGQGFRLALTDAAATALGLDGEAAALFTGEVTDPTQDPVAKRHRVRGTGSYGRGSRRTLAVADWQTHVDGARVRRILTRAAIAIGDLDAGTVDLVPPEGDDTAGSLLEVVTDSTGGSVIEQPSGLVDYHDADHRRDTPVTVTLTAAQVVSALTWEQHVDDIQNEGEIAWAGGVVTVREPSSIEQRGAYPFRRSTALATASDAHSLGQQIVGRRSEPYWQLPDLEVDLMRLVDDELRGQLLTLRHGDRLKVTGIPDIHPYSGDVEFFVEGWRMTLERIRRPEGAPAPTHKWRWRMAFRVSDPALSGVSLRWMDVTPGIAWEDVTPGLSWLDVTRIDDPADLT